MVQRKVPNKTGIKPHLHKLDTQLVNLKPSSTSSQTHEKLKKIMKKSRSIKRADEPRSLPPFKPKITSPATPRKQSPNYMKSTSSFEARKEQSPSPKTPIKKVSETSKTNESSSGVKGSRTSSLKVVRTLTKTPSFKPLRPSKKKIICEDVDSQRATCSSTLKDSKFPDYLQLNDGGTELDGTSTMKVCPYTYCSLNGHHHAPMPPLKCFLSARRRALKTQKAFKLGCLSPRQIKPTVKKSTIKEPVISTAEEVDMKDFFIDIYSDHREQPVAEMPSKDEYIRPKPTIQISTIKEPVIVTPKKLDTEDEDSFFDNYSDDNEQSSLTEIQSKDAYTVPKLVGPHECESLVHQIYSDDRECFDIDWEEGGYRYDSDGFKSHEIDGGVAEDQTKKMSSERLYNEHQELYDEESVSSGAWSEEDGDSGSDGSFQNSKINQDYMNYDEFELSSTDSEQDINDKMDQNINYQQEQTSQESKTVPDFEGKFNNEAATNRTTIIYNIIQFNISVFINGEKTEHTVQVPTTSGTADKMESQEAIEKQDKVVADEQLPFNVQDIESTEQSNAIEKQDDPEQECNECEACSYSTSLDEEPAIRSDVDQTHVTEEITSESSDELQDPCVNLGDLTNRKKPGEETGDHSREFNLRGPNFLPEIPDPDAETVDLRHQDIDERKNAEEWMVDYALQQAVTTLAPARKKKVALLVEAFEKVMPDPVPVRGPVRIPGYEPHNRHASKAFTNSRPIQACS